jgi:hypothetical protein
MPRPSCKLEDDGRGSKAVHYLARVSDDVHAHSAEIYVFQNSINKFTAALINVCHITQVETMRKYIHNLVSQQSALYRMYALNEND